MEFFQEKANAGMEREWVKMDKGSLTPGGKFLDKTQIFVFIPDWKM